MLVVWREKNISRVQSNVPGLEIANAHWRPLVIIAEDAMEKLYAHWF